MSRVVHFEIHATEPQKVKAFYAALFGWTFTEYMPGFYWLITTGPDGTPGINGALLQRRPGQTGDRVNGYVCIITSLFGYSRSLLGMIQNWPQIRRAMVEAEVRAGGRYPWWFRAIRVTLILAMIGLVAVIIWRKFG